MTTRPLPHPPSRDVLAALRSDVLAARSRVQTLRSGAVDRDELQVAHGVLLEAMEQYAAELDRRRLPTPPGLRDDLRLYRELRMRPETAKPYHPRGPA